MHTSSAQISMRDWGQNPYAGAETMARSPASSSVPPRLLVRSGTAAPTTISARITPCAHAGTVQCHSRHSTTGCATTASTPLGIGHHACTPFFTTVRSFCSSTGRYRTTATATAATDHATILATKLQNASRPHLRHRVSAIHAIVVTAGSASGSVYKPTVIAPAHIAQSAFFSGVRTRARAHRSIVANVSSISVYPLALVP